MKIIVLNGSPHIHGHTSAMVNVFVDGAKKANHQVQVFNVALMNIHGCLGCDQR